MAGRLGSVFGVRGEVTCVPTRVGEEAIVRGARVFVDEPVAGRSELVVASARRHRGRIVVAFDGVETADDAQRLVGRTISVARDAIALGKGEFLDDDLTGLHLVSESGESLGVVSSVRHFPAQDCLVVGPRDALVPLVGEFILDVDVAQGRILVRLPPGLLDDSLAEKA